MSKKSELKLVRDVEKWLQGKQGKYNKPIYTRRRKKGIEDMIMKEIELINISEKLDLILEELRKITACISTKDKGRSSIFIEEKKSHLPTLGA